MRIVSIIGARPQFIKCAPLSRALRKEHKEILVHTGQHYDPEMSDIFFRELNIPEPDYNLGIGSSTHGEQTGEMLIEIENVLHKENPDLVLVYGDTNSTLAGALAASKLHIKVAHVEAGLRSFDRSMPEEINRVLTDHVSNLLFCPTNTASMNLKNEGITSGVYNVGDIMLDSIKYNKKLAEEQSTILERLGLASKKYMVATVHRPSNTDSFERLSSIIKAFCDSRWPVVFSVHPRTKKYLKQYGLWEKLNENIKVVPPLGYLEMLKLMTHAKKILTDSGGIQKEAYILGVPCITMRESTEWVETLEDGWNVLVGADYIKIRDAIEHFEDAKAVGTYFGNGDTTERIYGILNNEYSLHNSYRKIATLKESK